MNIQVCRDASDAVALYLPQRLYLKPFAKLNISVQLPSQKVHGRTISNWELMEKLRKMIQPDSFSLLKVSKHSSEVIRFDAELESYKGLNTVIQRLDERVVKLNDYPEALKLKVCEAKSEFPSRHAWDSFFRDANDMDEMKPGERPDTVHISNLPIRWFVHKYDKDEDAPPSENIFKKVFEKFGRVRQVDVPIADPFRLDMKSGIRGIMYPTDDSSVYFEGYVQFNEYVGFVRCMDELRGKKLVKKQDDIAEWCSIRVDFDKTKHMTDAAVKRRAIVRERLAARKSNKEEEEQAEKLKAAKREMKERQKLEAAEREKLEKMRQREERRKKKQLAKLMEKDNMDLNSKVQEEQRKLMKAQKKLQAIRLIAELFKRIELRPELQRNGLKSQRYYSDNNARVRIVDKFKRQQEEILETQRKHLRSALDGRIVIRSALETKKPKRSSSLSSLSSSDIEKVVKTEPLPSGDPRMQYDKAAVPPMYGMPNPYSFGYPPFMPPGYAYGPQNYYPRAPYNPEWRGGRGARGRGARGRGYRPRLPFFDGPDATTQYYRYFKKLKESNEHDDRFESRSRSRSRSRRRSYTRSRSRRRSYSRSRSRSRRTRSRSRSRSRSKSRSRRSYSKRRTHHDRSRSRSRRRTKTRSRSKTPASKRSSKHDNDQGKTTPAKSDPPRQCVSPNKENDGWSPAKQNERWSSSPKET